MLSRLVDQPNAAGMVPDSDSIFCMFISCLLAPILSGSVLGSLPSFSSILVLDGKTSLIVWPSCAGRVPLIKIGITNLFTLFGKLGNVPEISMSRHSPDIAWISRIVPLMTVPP